MLSLAGISPFEVDLPAGITIVTWAERPDLAAGMYAVDVEIYPDIPGFEDVALEPFEEWMEHNMFRPTDSPDATFIALADEGVVGFAKLSLTAPTAAGHSMTAVRRAWRGRGIAGALKQTSINWALAHGYTELHTSNEERNAPINRLNSRLGYQPGTGRIHLSGPLLPPGSHARAGPERGCHYGPMPSIAGEDGYWLHGDVEAGVLVLGRVRCLELIHLASFFKEYLG